METSMHMAGFAVIYLCISVHQENMSVQYISPKTPCLYKTAVCRGIPIFLIFAPKHRLWVLVRTKFSIFTGEKISVYCMGKFL